MPLQALVLQTVPNTGLRDRGTVTSLSPTEWRVSGAAAAIGNTSAVLGFIQLCSGVYEVTRIGGSVIEFITFRSLPEAVAALTAKPRRRLTLVTESPGR